MDNFDILAEKTQIGNIINIEKVTGGLSHRMYKVTTDKGIYAVKELNPGIMKRKEAYSNFIFSEKVTKIAKENKINAIGAMKLNNNYITKINENYFMIFEWIEGKILKAEQITEKHCEVIGEILAKIHNIDYSLIEGEPRKELILEEFEWNKYIDILENQNKPYIEKLKQNIDMLYRLNKDSIKALEYANNNLVISHRDLDRKNVMWQDNIPFIIDWEASGYTNPTIELIQVGWYWSGGDTKNVDYDKFKKVISLYKKYYNGNIDNQIEILVKADVYGGLNWLNYNLQRALCIGNNYDQEEIELAENEIVQSIEEIKYNESQFDNILKIFNSIEK